MFDNDFIVLLLLVMHGHLIKKWGWLDYVIFGGASISIALNIILSFIHFVLTHVK